jgi:DNA (cytosine-5)-methyltransferase 1
MMRKLKVVELFAGVGGFRLGLEGWLGKSASSNYTKSFESPFEVIWSNQWEPSTKTQHASLVYESRWGKAGHSNVDINLIEVSEIPDHDVLVGGFPCQDYSVATTLKNSQGLIGKKGVLWWSIHKIIREKANKPKYLIFENVDRLLSSPSKQRGRDFAIILKSLCDLGYDVEWKVVNAAEYGMPQRRKRTFIICYQHCTPISQRLRTSDPTEWLTSVGVLAKAFPNQAQGKSKDFKIEGNIVHISNEFNKENSKDVFLNHGVLIGDTVRTIDLRTAFDGPFITLGQILDNCETPREFWIDDSEFEKWKYLKGAKKESRITPEGYEYEYSEGSMAFPDALDKPSRTIITGEGGRAPSRFKHVIMDGNRLRRLTPIELERLNMFPDNHTLQESVSDTKRAFFMGNALVVGVVEKIGTTLSQFISQEI